MYPGFQCVLSIPDMKPLFCVTKVLNKHCLQFCLKDYSAGFLPVMVIKRWNGRLATAVLLVLVHLGGLKGRKKRGTPRSR